VPQLGIGIGIGVENAVRVAIPIAIPIPNDGFTLNSDFKRSFGVKDEMLPKEILSKSLFFTFNINI
jgi:hypothetical protein